VSASQEAFNIKVFGSVTCELTRARARSTGPALDETFSLPDLPTGPALDETFSLPDLPC